MAETNEDPTVQADPRGNHKVTRQKVFLEQLAMTSSVKQSAEIANIANSTLYSWKENDADFAAAWLKALAAGYELLEMEMLERARKGVERKIFYRGKQVDTVRDYDHRAALQLLRLHKETVALVRAAQAEMAAEPEPVRDTLDEKLKKINVRLRKFQAEKRRKQAGDSAPDRGERNGAVHGA
ncbi:MAG: hypothetical protein ABJP02_18240 [Parasphingorhabdus sp.]|uniref:hypothetical protein n=1 Tax=Parasphingorhabdus sp. TaxID=2709688 RepID=UPI0032987C48